MESNRSKAPKHAKPTNSSPSQGPSLDSQETQVIPLQNANGLSAKATSVMPLPEISPSVDITDVGLDVTSNSNYDDADFDQTQALYSVPAYSAYSPAMSSQQVTNGTPLNPIDLGSKKSRKHNVGKIIGITLGCLLALVAAVYVGGALYFGGHFLPRTTAGSVDVSMMSEQDAHEAIDTSLSKYKLDISGQGLSFSLSADDAGLSIDSSKVVNNMMSAFNQWRWPIDIFSSHDLTDQMVGTVNSDGLSQTIKQRIDTFNETARSPENAVVSYSAAQNAFVITPETQGTALDVEKVTEAVDEALIQMSSKVKLSDEVLQKPSVLSTDTVVLNACDQANKLITANVDLQMAGISVAKLDSATISEWVSIGEDYAVSLNQDAMNSWAENLASQCNTVGSTRTYTRADGKECTVSGGVYGWSVDSAALVTSVADAVNNGTTGVVDLPYESSGDAYNGVGARDWGNRYIDIDLSEQYVRFYDDSGECVWETSCISGKPDGEHDTPTGVYWINQMASPSKLVGYENGVKIYESTVQYWMPFVGNAIGLHDANWQPSFGGTMYADGYGSHGCVNLPPAMAATLYGLIHSGDCVVCHW